MNVYSLIYAERCRNGDAANAICGPSLFLTHEQAVEEIYQYVEGRLTGAQLDEYVREHLTQLQSTAINTDDDQEMIIYFKSFDTEQKIALIDWFFNYADDETFEAFYQIEEHDLEYTDQQCSSHLKAVNEG